PLPSKAVTINLAPANIRKEGAGFDLPMALAVIGAMGMVKPSEHSVQSSWVREEVESCFERERREGGTVLFPVRLDGAIMRTTEGWAASIRRQRHIGIFENWTDNNAFRKALRRLFRDLKSS